MSNSSTNPPGGQKILFVDRDGVLIKEAPPSYQIDSWDKLEFYPGVFNYLGRIARELDYLLVMVSNQDGLGTSSFPEEKFLPLQQHIITSLANEGINFYAVHIDRSFNFENKPTRKPGIEMLKKYITDFNYNISGSFVIGDRITDVQLAKNLGCRAIWLNNDPALGSAEVSDTLKTLQSAIALQTTEWKKVYEFLKLGNRYVKHERNTNETKISIELNVDGSGKTEISTGLNFFNHLLEQLGKHSDADLKITVKGDLHIDEHHTIEDTAIALGEAFAKALGNKAGIGRYGFTLPMDDSLAQVALDFGGRSWLVWETEFRREKIGDVPTEMFYHFFKSFSDAAKCNLNIKVQGENEHHKIESVFKALAKSIKMAVKRDADNMQLPSTKGML
jgi:imidazoleglycerol-phosphate dehydratase/histidinol-phosphatase